ncbi:MAG TPA: wax ester/triacylglycerol synthase family O-acyltransferase, partial [Solirubrobacteraceae bacterium]|nr:wax ester/triacylglycerol synthase family O-acyltransferase [Solirubrobacteraceae bacterium]
HMHIGGVAIFEGPPPTREQFLEHVRARLPLVPRYRQKIAVPPIGLGRQRWVDDPSFNLEYHVRQTALPRPGDEDKLRRLTARIFSQRLDRTKPLWEMWLVEGLSRERFAIISKVHHSLVDGVAGVDLMTTLFDMTRVSESPQQDDPWQPRPEPSPVELSAATLSGWTRALMSLPWRAAAAAAQPARTLTAVRDTLEGIGELALTGLRSPAPDTPLNLHIGPHRRVAFVPASLADLKTIKDAFGGTVNDVVLAVVAGAMARFFHRRGLRVEGLELRAAVPISIRARDHDGALGNRITQVVTPLPIYISDPVQRLRRVTREMKGLKESKQALGAEAIAEAEDFAPPTILAQASRVNFSSRFYNLLVTNVPGPQFPLYVMGRQLELIFPVAFLAGDRALAIAIMSYNGSMNFGLIGDYDALPDIEIIAEGIEDALAELLSQARGERPRRSARRRTSAPRRASPAPRSKARARPRRRPTATTPTDDTAPAGDTTATPADTPTPPAEDTNTTPVDTPNGRSSTLAQPPA